jgi:hypothetical protein
MNDADSRLQRLLKTAAQAPADEPVSAPFGFDTRVVALWRAGHGNGGLNGVVRLIRRVVVLAAFLILVSGAAAFHEYQATRDIVEPGNNEFAIADSAIQSEFDQ